MGGPNSVGLGGGGSPGNNIPGTDLIPKCSSEFKVMSTQIFTTLGLGRIHTYLADIPLIFNIRNLISL